MPSKKKSASKPATAAAFPDPIAASTRQSSNPIPNATSLPSVDKSVPTYPEPDLRTGDTTESAGEPTNPPAVNRKKQRRRQKEAAKRLAENQSPQLSNGHLDPKIIDAHHMSAVKQGRGPVKGYFTEEPDYIDPHYQDPLDDPDDAFYSGDEDPDYIQDYPSGPENSWLNTSKRKKTPQKRPPVNSNSSAPRSNFPTLSNAALRSAHKMSSSNDNIWNTSTQAERENIKQFWLELGEDERRSLVRVEKEAVLRKMKEQQKHSCSCSVCGRKRTAIEEELEVLYDAYYQELEQFANHNNDLSDTSPPVTPSRTADSYSHQTHPMAGAYPVKRRIQELDEHGDELDDEDDDEYDDDEDDEDQYSDDDDYDDELPTGPSDFLQFGNSLTVKDGILTVADDLLKNNGKHFIDMMEQLAERRMQREQEVYYNSRALAHQARQGHNEPPVDDDDDFDDDLDVDEDYDSQEEDDFEGDEMDSMTEEQRMEEGRRMFQIFAARMFEQRVLTAYKEKVAAERQQKLLEELDEELRMDGQREAKKAKDAAKKKEKKARQKAAKDEEKAKKDAERIAQETAAREAEEKKAAEKKAKQEEQRKKREAGRKAIEEERLKKEAERLQRQQKEKERQQDAEKKARDAKEREKKQREEVKRKEREEREAKEAEARERRQKEEAERKSRHEQAQKEKFSAQKVDKDLRKGTDTANRPQPVALPPGLNPPSRNSQIQSPNFQVATPVVPPMLPTPVRSQQPSQPSQPSQSHSSSPRSPRESTEASQSSASPAMPSASGSAPIQVSKNGRQGPPLHHPQPSAPRSPLNNLTRGGQFAFNGAPVLGLGMNGTSMNGPPGMQHNLPPMPMHHGPPMGMNQRYPPNGLPFPPGFNQPRPYQPTHNMPFHPPLPNGPQVAPQHQPVGHKPLIHSRQASTSEATSQPAPIARPGPIARPSSTTPDKQKPGQHSGPTGVEQITTQLGSSALLDDSDEPFVGQLESKPGLAPVGAPGSSRLPFAGSFSNDKSGSFGLNSASLGGFHNGLSGGYWGSAPPRTTTGWPQPSFDPMGPPPVVGRPHIPRPVAVRLLLAQACRQLTSMAGAKTDGYHPVAQVRQLAEQMKAPGEAPIQSDEALSIFDTEGSGSNGGGQFDVIMDVHRGQIVKYTEESSIGSRAGLGDIGSPIMAPSQHSSHAVSSFGSIGQGVSHQHSYVQHAPGFGAPGRSF